ncbi:MAG: insulinase family protein [Alphaproteobacteria bacterium]|nr:insulinase family protein [Alphaproteobacteria bacterium]
MATQISKLKNGLRVVTDTIPHVETAALGIWVNIGTRHEKAKINGIAHMLEHMAFKGTKTRKARDIAEQIEAVGGYLNAATSREMTAYYARVLKGDMPLALDILSDILLNSVFDPEELERERAVILQEINQANDTPDDVIFDYFQETAFPNQAMGRPILGSAEIIKKIDRETLLNFMQNHYLASRMVLAATGNVDHDQIVTIAEKCFADLNSDAPVALEPALYKGGDFRNQRDLEQVHMIMGFEGVSMAHKDYYVATLLATLLGGGMSSRLFQEIREKRGLVYSIYAFKSSYTDAGLFAIYAGTGPDQVEELIPIICDEINKVTDLIEENELQRAKAQLKAGLLMGLESTSNRCEQLAQHMLFYGRPISSTEISERIEAVTVEDLKRIARIIFSSAPTLTSIGPIQSLEAYNVFARRLS